MKEYIDLVKTVLDKGTYEENRTGVCTKTCFAKHFEFDMSSGYFPLLTTKFVSLKNIAVELEGYIKGIQDKRWYQERGCHIWDEWCNPHQIPQELYLLDKEEKECYRPIQGQNLKTWQKENPDLGCGYGWQLRTYNKEYKPIPFIWTGFDKTITPTNTNLNNKYIGQTFDTKYGQATIIDFNKKYLLKFHKTGYQKSYNITDILKNKVKDPYYPKIVDVACYGEPKGIIDKTIEKKLSLIWRAMIRRCYDKNNHDYHNYGGNGVYVSNSWLIFSNYLRDVIQIDGWENKLKDWHNYQLDKDILSGKCYSKDTCLWITTSKNRNYTKKTYFFDAISPEGLIYKNNLGLKRFCKTYNLKVKTVEASIKNNTSTHHGWKFIRKDNLYKQQIYVDQLKDICDKLKTNPRDRRLLVFYYNPRQTKEMALPPCLVLFNLVFQNGKLNLFWQQRSCDLMLGAPYDIASNALLLLLLCKETGLSPGVLHGSFADLHIYNNHIETAKLQVTREPLSLPKVEIVNWKNIFEWTHKDVHLSDYKHHEKLKFDIAV